MIVNVRGTNGSGKSTAVRMLIDSLGGFDLLTPHYEPGKKRPLFYTHSRRFALLGHYEAQCGGADVVEYRRVPREVLRLHEEYGNVIYEGMLWSRDVKWALWLKGQVDDLRVIFLTTPVERSIKNIRKRQLERYGEERPFQPDRVKINQDGTDKTRLRLEAAGVYCRSAPVRQAAKLMRKWLCSMR